MTRVANLAKPTGLNASCYRFGKNEDGTEREYYPSFQSLLHSADALAAVTPNAPYQDAYHLLNFSIECFMKYVFCIVREDTWARQNPEGVEGNIPILYRRAFAIKPDKLSAGSFGHDIVWLMDELRAATVDLDRNDFGNLRKELVSDRNSWVADRYKIRQHSQYKPKFDRRRRLFQAVLTGTFARFV